jgi:hypothetical protein
MDTLWANQILALKPVMKIKLLLICFVVLSKTSFNGSCANHHTSIVIVPKIFLINQHIETLQKIS